MIINEITNINQNMHIPAYLYAEHLSKVKFADEFAKISAKEKIKDNVEKVTQIEETSNIDEETEHKKQTFNHIDLKG